MNLNHAQQASRIAVDALKRLRLKRGMSQQKLADKVGISRVAVTLIEAGKRNPSFYVILALASALDCKLSTLTAKTEKEMAAKR